MTQETKQCPDAPSVDVAPITEEELDALYKGGLHWGEADLLGMIIASVFAVIAAAFLPDPWTPEWQALQSESLAYVFWLVLVFISFAFAFRYYWRLTDELHLYKWVDGMNSTIQKGDTIESYGAVIGYMGEIRAHLLSWVRKSAKTPAIDYYSRRLTIEIDMFFSFFPELLGKAWMEPQATPQQRTPQQRLLLRQANRWTMDICLHMVKNRRPFRAAHFEYWTLLYVVAAKNKLLREYDRKAYNDYCKSVEDFQRQKVATRSSRWASFFDVAKALVIPIALTVLTAAITGLLHLK